MNMRRGEIKPRQVKGNLPTCTPGSLSHSRSRISRHARSERGAGAHTHTPPAAPHWLYPNLSNNVCFGFCSRRERPVASAGAAASSLLFLNCNMKLGSFSVPNSAAHQVVQSAFIVVGVVVFFFFFFSTTTRRNACGH